MRTSLIRRLGGATPQGVPLARDVLRSGLARVFGPPPFDPATDPGDPGLFGPDAASWRVIGEPAAIVGGLRALLVQLLHPLAMAGVADHSRFREDPLGRLHTTAAYVTTTTFASTRQAFDIVRVVRHTHERVVGVAPDGRAYRASDPHLLAWVSVALTSSFLATDRAYAPRPVDEATADRFAAEQSRAAALLDPRVDIDELAADPKALAELRAGTLGVPMLDEGRLPLDVEGVRERLATYAPELGLNAQGREALRFLLWPSLAPSVRAGYLPALAGAVATLEPHERRLLGLPKAPLMARGVRVPTSALLAGMRLALGQSPARRAAARRVDAGAGRYAGTSTDSPRSRTATSATSQNRANSSGSAMNMS